MAYIAQYELNDDHVEMDEADQVEQGGAGQAEVGW